MEVIMAKWLGDWEFRNVMHRKDGSSGTETVEAPNESAAEEAIRCEVSQKLFYTTMMRAYVQVSNISKIKY
ncbi:hypothetical protein A3B05_03005 [Candidatus Giovannonibacteria bacterium RIFCSPLOWO2_01_FULL_43_160]|uniref:Uncharacterized protein n=2 Tax=Candidatus Giovannoniibacteriota TaxID=1752738 RepID=A0A1F5XVM6_9BACT|nr:MAG: hypothetical protein UV72_C0010G0010 [Candidatus Giovannonibacteria bacterium GW2011_GWB1_43_13]OGF58130.1 MAG: hypothetical protein A2652_02810 [Candidatus Giovannonibacteria bacterium RIFCSPHIGHO2_01_FULL_43_140]OGF70388.1 MAG: hypothetical protein A3C76_01315 [Candidatus Giovannonibacteria bacterium RIFCSPHIGHO2_02_FULL_44_51]OGF71382.1 MAG: hypothetical protein A3E35_03115 [Candidatus Giovannonibacteria bacterium RIFCSPHIGHO2_12_FULL_44_22]OGF74907.1 MAG: hypothetical protein A3B05_